jgi:purine-binding chemotaxis protein CheW
MTGRPRRQTDWREFHERLARAQQALAEAERTAPERARVILQDRARALARAPAPAPQAGEVLDVVVFILAGESYAVEAAYVREAVRLTDYTPVPGVPDFLVGVINLRGEIVAVIDLRKFFGMAARGVTDLSRVLVLGAGRAEFGILADAAHEVMALRKEAILEPPASLTGAGREYLRGVTEDALIVLDGATLLQDGRLFIDQKAEQETAHSVPRPRLEGEGLVRGGSRST